VAPVPVRTRTRRSGFCSTEASSSRSTLTSPRSILLRWRGRLSRIVARSRASSSTGGLETGVFGAVSRVTNRLLGYRSAGRDSGRFARISDACNPESGAEIHGVAGLPMTGGWKRSKGNSDAGQARTLGYLDGPGIDNCWKMQSAAPTDTAESDAGAAEDRQSTRGMTPLTQSKMHAEPAPARAQPAAPRRSALVIELLAFVLIAFLLVSA